MSRISVASRLIGAALVLCAGMPAVAQSDRPETALRQELEQAVWPADIVRKSRDYLGRYSRGAAAAQAKSSLDLAERSVRMLERKDVRLYRADFEAAGSRAVARDDARQAALGDKEAALRFARLYGSGEGGMAQDMNRYVGWLQYAAALGNGLASYELALHYRREDQPVLAAPYEARAEELGYIPPPSLDHVRK